MPGFTKRAQKKWAEHRLQPGTDVYSDGLGAFRVLGESGGGRARCEAANACWVNVVLGNLKRSLDGVYHAFSFFKYAHRYLAETAWRFNRRFDLQVLLPRLLAAAIATKPWPERALRDVPVFSTESSC